MRYKTIVGEISAHYSKIYNNISFLSSEQVQFFQLFYLFVCHTDILIQTEPFLLNDHPVLSCVCLLWEMQGQGETLLQEGSLYRPEKTLQQMVNLLLLVSAAPKYLIKDLCDQIGILHFFLPFDSLYLMFIVCNQLFIHVNQTQVSSLLCFFLLCKLCVQENSFQFPRSGDR